MPFNLRWLTRAAAVFRPTALHRDLEDELSFHVEARTRDNVAAGMTPEAARLDALRRFGNPTATAERMRDMDVTRWLDTTLRNLRYSGRMLRRNPGFSAVVVVSIAIGIGANTAIFSLLNAVLLKTLPVRDPQQLVALQARAHDAGGERVPLDALRDVPAFQEHARKYLELFMISATSAVTTLGGQVEQVGVGMVSGNYYRVLGVPPFLGRFIGADDDRIADPQLVAVLSYEFWRDRFGSDPAIVGREIVLNGITYSIVGVSPRGLNTSLESSTSVIVPLATENRIQPGVMSFRWIEGRLAAGVSRQRAQSVLTSLFQSSPHHQSDVIVVTDNSRGDYPDRDRLAQPLVVLMAAVMLVLLIACANVASLLLARGAARRREMSIRLALGAGRTSVLLQLLTESAVIALCGAVLGIGVAYAADGALLSLLGNGSDALPLDVHPDWRVLTFTTCVAVLTGLLFGLLPAFQAARTELNPGLKEGHGVMAGRPRLVARRVLVVAQIALSLVLLAGAGLFVRTLNNLRTLDAGYDRRGVLLVFFQPGAGLTRDRMYQLDEALLERARALPGVASAGLASTPVLSQGTYKFALTVPGRTQPCDSSMTIASSGYLETMRMTLLAGRHFSAADNQASAPATVIVNQEIVRRCFAGESPIGRRVKAADGPDAEIIGVVANARYRDLRESALPMYYIPPRLVNPYGLVLHVRASNDPHALTPLIRAELRAIDPGIPLTRALTLQEQSERALSQDRLVAIASATFGIGALGLAAIGLYGVLTFIVAHRTNEIGVRMAMGARRPDVLRLVLRESFTLLLLGGTVGLAGAYAARTAVESLLFGVDASDQWTLAAAAGVLGCVALLASLIPAVRASRIDPMTALRHE
jgi:predicted permease